MRLKFALLLIGIAPFFFSCAEKRIGEEKTSVMSNFLSLTENEDNGVKEILDYYGGRCEYSVGTKVSTSNGKVKYFILDISSSPVIEGYADVSEMPASNVAYLFYRNLKEEKDNYDEIHVKLQIKEDIVVEFVFPKSELEIVDSRIPSMLKIVDLIKTKDFEAITPYLNDTSEYSYDKNELVQSIRAADDQFGAVKDFMPFGFRIREQESGISILHISGIIFREKQDHEFSADFDLSKPKDELLMIQYKL